MNECPISTQAPLFRQNPQNSPVRLVVLYDSLAAAACAQEAVQMLAPSSQWRSRVQCSVWSFDLLAQPNGRRISAEKAMEADVIMVAAASRSGLPPHVASWLTNSLRKSRRGAPVMVAVFEAAEPQPGDIPALRKDLVSIAARWRTPLLCNADARENLERELGPQSAADSTTSCSRFQLRQLLSGPAFRSWPSHSSPTKSAA